MKITVKKSILKGELNAPASKSITQRALIAASLCCSDSIIINPLIADDTLHLINFIKSQTETNILNNSINIKGNIDLFKTKKIFTGESGFLTRVLTTITGIYKDEIQIIFDNTLKYRNLDDLIRTLSLFGVNVKINYEEGYIIKSGQLKAGNYVLDFNDSSQVLSGLLFALPLLESDSIIKVNNLVSKPYISMTLTVLRKYGINIENEGFSNFYIKRNQNYNGTEFEVENDWSNTAFLLVASEIAGNFQINNLNIHSVQGDKIIIDIINEARANMCINFNAVDYPDLIPALIPLCLNLENESRISGISRLKNKESNRAEAIINEFSKINANLKVEEDSFIINKSELVYSETNSHNDHRIAMSLAVTGLNMESGLKIDNFECVNKSYPNFINDIKSVGGIIHE